MAYIYRESSEEVYEVLNNGGSFDEDWQKQTDEILREATEEEKQIFIKEAGDKVIPFLTNYEIY